MRIPTLLRLICGLLVFLFVYTAVSKALAYSQQVRVLAQSPLIHAWAAVLGWALPVAEAGIALLLLFPRTQRWGLYSSGIALLMFTGYIGYMLLAVPHLPCSCGGVIGRLTWRQHLLLNAFFLVLNGWGICLVRKARHWHPQIPYPDRNDLT